MIVVSDASPLIALMKAGQLELLEKLYGNVIIPQAVFDELTINNKYPAEAELITGSTFITVVKIKDSKSVRLFQQVTGLDLGESEAIKYAADNNADLVLIDELSGRLAAKKMELNCIGSLGVLIMAYKKKHINANAVKAAVEQMKSSNIYFDDKLTDSVLKEL